MPYCSKCGAELDEGVKFCPTCGTPVGPPTKPERRRIERGRRPISTLLAIVLIVIIVVGAAATAVFLLWWRGAFRPSGLIVGSGNLVTEEMEFSDFTIVEVGWAFKVEITQASSYSVNITADDNFFDYIEASKAGDTLTISLKSGYNYRPLWPWTKLTLKAEITMPELHELELSGGTHGTLEGFSSSHEFVVLLSGASSLNGDFTTTEDAQFTVSGASSAELEGAANDLTVNVEGASRLELSDFSVHNARVTLGGASRATVNLDGRLDGDVSGASHLLYMGNPTAVEVHTSGGSTVGPQ